MSVAVLESVVRPRLEDTDLTGRMIRNARTKGFQARLLERIDGRVYRMQVVLFHGMPVNFQMTADYHEAAKLGA